MKREKIITFPRTVPDTVVPPYGAGVPLLTGQANIHVSHNTPYIHYGFENTTYP
ncbi:MAG: hypothetical protein IID16_09850 [Candidatus Marinimicrobia bacterium]|nr:hypothetical protein [Candidatus Neomarinimicrobiota bacterium]